MQKNIDNVKVTVVTVVYGSRWPLLKQVAESCLSDDKVSKFVICDNGSIDPFSMDEYAAQYKDRVVILRQTTNIGFSGAIAKCLEYAQGTDSDYVLILDDDSVPEEGAIDMFLDNLKFFGDEVVVLSGNRTDVPGNKEVFRQRPFRDKMPKGTIFDVFSLKKVISLGKLLFRIKPDSRHAFVPIIPTEAFVTGGSFIPMEVVRKAPLPDARLFIYGEDLEYSWRIRRLGYPIYLCSRPIIRDIDMTFPSYGYHIFGLFDSATPEYKIYFRMRNSVIISKRNTTQSSPVLALNIIIWFIGLSLIGLHEAGISKVYFTRMHLIGKAMRNGFKEDFNIPSDVVTPT
jgi:GT2 family glycosyltransferase